MALPAPAATRALTLRLPGSRAGDIISFDFYLALAFTSLESGRNSPIYWLPQRKLLIPESLFTYRFRIQLDFSEVLLLYRKYTTSRTHYRCKHILDVLWVQLLFTAIFNLLPGRRYQRDQAHLLLKTSKKVLLVDFHFCSPTLKGWQEHATCQGSHERHLPLSST